MTRDNTLADAVETPFRAGRERAKLMTLGAPKRRGDKESRINLYGPLAAEFLDP
jgi:hypothetical protein